MMLQKQRNDLFASKQKYSPAKRVNFYINRVMAKRSGKIRAQYTYYTHILRIILYRVVVKLEDRDRILKAYHQDFGGHFGRHKTFSKISERYFWKGMKKDVVEYIAHCDRCQRVNRNISNDAPPLHPIAVPKELWAQVGMDLIGPLPKTPRGNQYICGLSCYLSKWPEAVAIPQKCAAYVAEVLYGKICHLGAMETLITDQGREFVNQLNDELCDKFHIQHRIASLYHPQTNGLQERMNQTLKNAILKMVDDHAENWDLFLNGVLFSYRTAVVLEFHHLRLCMGVKLDFQLI